MTRYSILRLLAAPVATLVLVAGLGGCASERRGVVGHAYDNVVARDNGYFLAREKLRGVEAKLYQARQNDYNQVLTLFPTLDQASVGTVATDLEDVVKKASLPIQYRAASDWTDDAYILIGKSRYYKMEFEDAAKTFKYVNSTSKDPNAKHEALIWLMRTFLASKELENAKAVSDLLDKEEGREVNARALFLTRADYYLKTDEPLKAIENLERAIPLVEPKNEQSRTRYILAQLYQNQGEDKKAYAELNKILKKNPPYELDFFSKLMLGQVSDLNNNDKARLDKYFAKLLKDTKNKEYRDKIYYEMARLDYRQQRYDDALKLLQQSARAGSANRAQKSYTYLLAGRIYYENLQKYRLAAAYYDSTVQNLSKDAPNFVAISERAGILKDFAQQYSIIETQDSLQALARLDTTALRTRLTAYADAELETKRKAAEVLAAKQERESSRQALAAGISTSRDLQTDINPEDFINGSTGAKWYFDNPTAMSTARADFIRRWGDRPLQDNWRTVTVASASPVAPGGGNVPVSIAGTNQTKVTAGATTGLGEAAATADPAVQRKALVAQYRQTLPLTPELMVASEKQVEEALYSLGTIYNQQLRELTPAAQTYEKLLTRFPKTTHSPETYYSLYLIYKEQNELAKAEVYAQRLRQEFPNSAYARLAADPEYLRRASLVNKEVAVQVDTAFAMYKRQDFKKAAALLAQTSKKFPETDLNDRIAYLNTLIDIRTQPPLTAKNSLEKFVKAYQESPLSNDARTLLESYKKYDTGGIPGALASTQKPTISMFRPGEINNRVRILYNPDTPPVKATPLVTPAATAPAPVPTTPAPTSEQPKLPATSQPPPASPTDSSATSTTPAATSPAAPPIDPVKAARMAAAQDRARGKKPAKKAPAPATVPVVAATSVPASTPPPATTPTPSTSPAAGTPTTTNAAPAASVAIASPYAVNPANPAGVHAVVLVFPKAAVPLQTLPTQLGTYNSRYFKASNLQVQQQPLGDSLEMVVVQGLSGVKIAQAYALKLRGPQSPLNRLRGVGYQTLVIGIDNLPLLLQRRDVEEYQRFYQQTYR
ncbi:tetratricopeptide repeat protein [Hymenobacter tibetensis]|uniref:Tetratricopeptide repeat protein n=1 Tax=Hymenobacter tibetensis TaxID=497967 RepID=A0ABY4D020_9BACT|nr:tetratricopeptide repeat protein [Hymenobacter tibetensis]UOG75372.1 tetratricopeptide repeat protein [Hymenobacter tibetensis]